MCHVDISVLKLLMFQFLNAGPSPCDKNGLSVGVKEDVCAERNVHATGAIYHKDTLPSRASTVPYLRIHDDRGQTQMGPRKHMLVVPMVGAVFAPRYNPSVRVMS